MYCSHPSFPARALFCRFLGTTLFRRCPSHLPPRSSVSTPHNISTPHMAMTIPPPCQVHACASSVLLRLWTSSAAHYTSIALRRGQLRFPGVLQRRSTVPAVSFSPTGDNVAREPYFERLHVLPCLTPCQITSWIRPGISSCRCGSHCALQ